MGGMSWQGVLPGRPNDTLGSMVAYTHFSNQPNLGASPGSGEFIVEGFYNFQVTPWLGVQPDVQFINQPSSVPGQSVPNAVVLTVRITMSF
jgi:carbohydrate-selective porin OprB